MLCLNRRTLKKLRTVTHISKERIEFEYLQRLNALSKNSAISCNVASKFKSKPIQLKDCSAQGFEWIGKWNEMLWLTLSAACLSVCNDIQTSSPSSGWWLSLSIFVWGHMQALTLKCRHVTDRYHFKSKNKRLAHNLREIMCRTKRNKIFLYVHE